MADDDIESDEAHLTFYHGTRAKWSPGSLINPGGGPVYVTPHLDAAIWAAELSAVELSAAELSDGEQEPHVYQVACTGSIEDVTEDVDYVRPPHPAMSLRTRDPVAIIEEVTEWDHYHGTRAALQVGDLIEPGHAANFGLEPRAANFVYFTRTLDASIWGAELAAGEGRGRIYLVEPTGPIEEDPNLTNARFRGNPTKSFRSRAPIRVVGELLGWEPHPPAVVSKMKEGLARLTEAGVAAIDD